MSKDIYGEFDEETNNEADNEAANIKSIWYQKDSGPDE